MREKSQKPRKEQETEEYEEKKKGEWRGKGKLFLWEVQQVVQQRTEKRTTIRKSATTAVSGFMWSAQICQSLMSWTALSRLHL